ncbi:MULTISPECIES: sensor domain-containing diguanylate cyclase [unclassified Vibrio]|uniref:diguanylate cyclase n=1 Tax=Vibrio sp. HB236076 TaxID=3232307 RepID=A0AB39HK10_9VIBR|nr:sensor domain-containing diguanylate cyclase [Vibrio sp. HB161653]MDP5255005.1 sensor domain-containing diguanylate cyclase [Vibrio sp. HB161653]
MPEINFDSTYGVIVLKDLEPVYVDDNYARIYGYDSAQDLLQNINSFLDLIDPKHHQMARENYYRQISGDIIPRGRTFKNIDRYGRSITVFTIDHVIKWHGEDAIQVTVMDMSAVEQAHLQIKENERKYKQLITTSGQGINVHRNFKPLMVNQAWVNLMHAPSIEHVLQKVNLLDFIPEPERESAINNYQDIVSGQVKGSCNVVENICYDGVRRHFRVYDNLIDWDGEPAVQVVIEDVTEKIELEKQLERRSITDALTEVFNRRQLDQVLNDEHGRFMRYGHSYSVILLDLDHFKSINDNRGHQAGDKTLKMVAHWIQNNIRDVDVIGRWGGEEFLVICPNTEHEQGLMLAEKLRLGIEGLIIDGQFQVTTSIGVATSGAEKEVNDVLRFADKALYLAKANGRNRVESEVSVTGHLNYDV